MNYTINEVKPFGVLIQALEQNTQLSSLDSENLRILFEKHQLIVLRGFNTFQNADAFADYCESWGRVSLWPFGKVLELIEQDNPQDHIFDHNYMPLHWDGMYRPQIPEYQIFHCVKAPLPGHGGKTTFSNTLLVLQNLAPELRALCQQVTGVYQRKMEFYNSKTVSPLITQHPFKNLEVIRYNEPPSEDKGKFINSPDLEFLGIPKDELKSLHEKLHEELYAPQHFYAHEWQDGDIVIADNFSLLHGREAFVSKSPRHIQRVHVLSNPQFDNPGLESYA